MIAGLVAQFESRLENNPNDPDSWQRLRRSYNVLGEFPIPPIPNFYATNGKPDDPNTQLNALERLLARGLIKDHLAKATVFLQRFCVAGTERSEYLFFAVHLARLCGDDVKMRAFWQQLLDISPKDFTVSAHLIQELAEWTFSKTLIYAAIANTLSPAPHNGHEDFAIWTLTPYNTLGDVVSMAPRLLKLYTQIIKAHAVVLRCPFWR